MSARSAWPLGAWLALALVGALGGAATASLATGAVQGERCFGAAGMECGLQSALGQAALCVGPKCAINGGSWEHDECCWHHAFVLKDGKSCVSSGPNVPAGVGKAQVCNASWQKALQRTSQGWSWYRNVDTQKRNATGKVVFSEYCAVKGSRVHRYDVKYCCSKKAQSPFVPDHPDARICT